MELTGSASYSRLLDESKVSGRSSRLPSAQALPPPTSDVAVHNDGDATQPTLMKRRSAARLTSKEQSDGAASSVKRPLRVGAGAGVHARAADELPATIPEEDWDRYVGKTKDWLLFPLAPLKFRWDLMMLGLILYSCVSVPFRLGLGHFAEGGWWWFEVVVSLCFIADIFLTFHTAHPLGNNALILDRAMIRGAYLRGWFAIDCLSSLPMELFEGFELALQPAVPSYKGDAGDDGAGGEGGSVGELRALRALRLIRLLRLLRLLKIQRYVAVLEDWLSVNIQVFSLFKVVAALLYLAHLLACGWYYIALHVKLSDSDGSTWLHTYNGGHGLDAGVWERYLYSLYCELCPCADPTLVLGPKHNYNSFGPSSIPSHVPRRRLIRMFARRGCNNADHRGLWRHHPRE